MDKRTKHHVKVVAGHVTSFFPNYVPALEPISPASDCGKGLKWAQNVQVERYRGKGEF